MKFANYKQPWWGTPRNPYNDQYYPGGSSTGSAYSVATGLVPISAGLDKGGSVRAPSTHCGVYGLMTTFGRVSLDHISTCSAGVIAASIADLEVAYRVMAIPNPYDSVSSSFKIPQPVTGNRQKVIGIYDSWFQRSDSQVQRLCTAAINHLRDVLGYEIVPISIPYLPEAQRSQACTALVEMSSFLNEKAKPYDYEWLPDLSATSKEYFSVASQTSGVDYCLAAKMRNLLMSHLAFLFEKHPGLLIVTPSNPEIGYIIEKEVDLKYGISNVKATLRSMEYYFLSNYTGCPSLTCPVGYAEPKKGNGDLPVGLMAMSEWG